MGTIRLALVALCFLTTGAGNIAAQECERIGVASVGSSLRWGSGWLDLAEPTSFEPGETIRLRLDGDATEVLIRLLTRGADPNSPIGLIGDPVSLQGAREISVEITDRFEDVIQISVHGGPSPWGIHLDPENGAAKLLSAEVCR